MSAVWSYLACGLTKASTSELDDAHSSTIDDENDISNISLVTSHMEEQPSGPTLDEPEIDDGDVNPK
ncbi:hypothetical protein Tco_0030891 [Tanacetum coccineum]